MKKNTLSFILAIAAVWTSVDAVFAIDFSNCAGHYTIPANKPIINIGLDEITPIAYEACSNKPVFSDGKQIGTSPTIKTKEDIMDAEDAAAVKCVSKTEGCILLEKQDALQESTPARNLSYDEKKRLAEIQNGITCGIDSTGSGATAQNSDIITCSTDILFLEWSLRKNITGMFAELNISLELYKTRFVNSLIFGISYFASFSDFGFSSFDKLPPLPFEAKDLFDSKKLVGVINLFALSLVSLLILFYLTRRATDRQEDSYTTFFIKIAAILFLMIGFPAFYGQLKEVSDSLDASYIKAFSSVMDPEAIRRGIGLNLFQTSGIRNITAYTFIFGIPNFLGLVFISVVVVLRNVFLQFVSYVFFIFAIGLLVGTIRKDNSEASDLVAKASKKLILALFWALALFISIVESIALFKILAIFLGFVTSVETDGKTILESLDSFGLDTFIYIGSIIGVLYVWKKYLLPLTYSLISDFITGIFMADSQRAHINDFYTSISTGYETIKQHHDDMRMNNPDYLSLAEPVRESMSEHFEEFKENHPVAKKILEHHQLTDEQSFLRRNLKTVASLATGAGQSAAMTEQLERRRVVEQLDAKIQGLDLELKEFSPEIPEHAKSIQRITTRKRLLQNERNNISTKYENTLDVKTSIKKSKGAHNIARVSATEEDVTIKTGLQKEAIKGEIDSRLIAEDISLRNNFIQFENLELDEHRLNIRLNDGSSDAVKGLEILRKKRAKNNEAYLKTLKEKSRLNEIRDKVNDVRVSPGKKSSKEGTDATENNKSDGSKVSLELPPELLTTREVIVEKLTKNQKEIDPDISEFIQKYQEYKKSGDQKDLTAFGKNKIVSDLLKERFSTQGNIDGIDTDITMTFDRISREYDMTTIIPDSGEGEGISSVPTDLELPERI